MVEMFFEKEKKIS